MGTMVCNNCGTTRGEAVHDSVTLAEEEAGSTSAPDMTCSCAVLVVDVVVALIIIIIAMERNPWKL